MLNDATSGADDLLFYKNNQLQVLSLLGTFKRIIRLAVSRRTYKIYTL